MQNSREMPALRALLEWHLSDTTEKQFFARYPSSPRPGLFGDVIYLGVPPAQFLTLAAGSR